MCNKKTISIEVLLPDSIRLVNECANAVLRTCWVHVFASSYIGLQARGANSITTVFRSTSKSLSDYLCRASYDVTYARQFLFHFQPKAVLSGQSRACSGLESCNRAWRNSGQEATFRQMLTYSTTFRKAMWKSLGRRR